MITFTYELKGRSINWTAQWDGSHDNDPLLEDYRRQGDLDQIPHPFRTHIDYENALRNYIDRDIPGTLTHKLIHSPPTKLQNQHGELQMELDTPSYADYINPESLRSVGDTVRNNPVTRAICEMISDTKNMRNHCGGTHPWFYQTNLIGVLSRLWD